MDDLYAMGYAPEWKEQVLKASTVGYLSVLEKLKKIETKEDRNQNIFPIIGYIKTNIKI